MLWRHRDLPGTLYFIVTKILWVSGIEDAVQSELQASTILYIKGILFGEASLINNYLILYMNYS